jgi:tetratricopeptide (TPR) repeat protein
MALVTVAAACAMAQKVKNTNEAKAIQEIQKAKTPDEIIAAVDKFVVGFPDSEFKSQALSAAAEAAEQKGGDNWTKAVSYGDLAIAADPNNFDALLLVSAEIAQHTPENSLTNELDKAQKYAEQALAAIPTVTKPVDSKMPDAAFEAFKKDGIARAHGAMGMIAGKRKKWDVAATEFQTAVDTETQPDSVLMARLGNAYNQIGKPADAIVVLNKVLAMQNLNPAVKSFAENEKKKAEAAAKK